MRLKVFLIILPCALSVSVWLRCALYSSGPRTRSPVEVVTTPGMEYAGPNGVR
jgi:hypothetical protein